MVLMLGKSVILQTCRILVLFKKYPQFEDINTRIDVMIYEFGEFTKYFKVYAKAYGHLSAGYKAEARVCLAALLIQIEMFCISNDWDINVLRNEGYEHLLDKIEEVEAKGGKMI
ncbi:MAG: hypothetical protein ACT6FG_00325 [Methanosarcinaceae archaeon]